MTSFLFVASNGAKGQEDPGVRTMIRKQAMRDVAIERKKRPRKEGQPKASRPSRKHKVARPPEPGASQDGLEMESPQSASITTGTSKSDSVDACDLTVSRHCSPFSWSLSPSPEYEATRARFAIDITELAILTNWNVNQSTASLIISEPKKLIQLLGVEAWSFLEYVPSRYSASPVIAAATDCVLAKINSCILWPFSQETDDTCRSLYGKALRELQSAVACKQQSLGADVLCATQLLALHELLDVSRHSAWQHHVKGAAKLIQHRTPTRFQTDYDKALLASHIGGITSLSLFGNKACYLDDPLWQSTYLSLGSKSTALTERSPLALKLRRVMLLCPGVWHDIDFTIKGEDNRDHRLLLDLQRRCERLHSDLMEWLDEYKSHCVDTSLLQITSSQIDLRRELFGTAHEALCLIKRLLASVVTKGREKLETETQVIAGRLIEMQKDCAARHSWLFTEIETGVAFSIMLTKDEWLEDESPLFEDNRLAARQRYVRWNNMLRPNS